MTRHLLCGGTGGQPDRTETTEGRTYHPGDRVPASGIYDVLHDNLDGHEHAQPHQVTVLQGTAFPPCLACHGQVRFQLHQQAEHMDSHALFRR